MHSFNYPVYSVICYANYWKKFSYETIEKKILGCKYVPLRREFSDCKKKKIEKQVKKLLILSGGTDQYNILEQILLKIGHIYILR